MTGQTYEARDPRWTDQTQDLVADLLYRRNGDSHVDACRVLDALAATGLLLPPSGYTREVFEVRTRGVRWPCDTEEAAWAQFAAVKGWPGHPPVQVYRQTITKWADGRAHHSPLIEVQP